MSQREKEKTQTFNPFLCLDVLIQFYSKVMSQSVTPLIIHECLFFFCLRGNSCTTAFSKSLGPELRMQTDSTMGHFNPRHATSFQGLAALQAFPCRAALRFLAGGPTKVYWCVAKCSNGGCFITKLIKLRNSRIVTLTRFLQVRRKAV